MVSLHLNGDPWSAGPRQVPTSPDLAAEACSAGAPLDTTTQPLTSISAPLAAAVAITVSLCGQRLAVSCLPPSKRNRRRQTHGKCRCWLAALYNGIYEFGAALHWGHFPAEAGS